MPEMRCSRWLSQMAVLDGCPGWLSWMAGPDGCPRWLAFIAGLDGWPGWLDRRGEKASGAKMTDQIAMDRRIAGNDIAVVQRLVARGKVRNKAASFTHKQHTGSNVPDAQPLFP